MSAPLRRTGAPTSWGREATLVLAIIQHPVLFERQEEALFGLALEIEGLDRLLREVISALSDDPALDSEGLKGHLRSTEAADILERILKDEALNRQTFLRPAAEIEEVEWGWRDALRHHLIATDSRKELAESASQSYSSGEEIWKAAVTAREELINLGGEPGVEKEVGASSKDLLDRLDRMRKSVERKKRH
jgi:DNA primase